ARLKGLVDDASAPAEIGFAARDERDQRHLFRKASALRLQDPRDRALLCRSRQQLDLPDPLAAIAAVLLDDARAGRSQVRRKAGGKLGGAAVELRVRPPAELPGAI